MRYITQYLQKKALILLLEIKKNDSKICSCEKCVNEIVDIALQDLSEEYVASGSSNFCAKIDMLDRQAEVDFILKVFNIAQTVNCEDK